MDRREEEERVRIAVFGGTGKTGWLTVRYAVEAGYGCKVLTRNPERMPSTPGVEFLEGNAVNGGRVMLTLTGCDAVIVALRGGKGEAHNLLSTAVSHIVSGMRKLEITRLILLSSIASPASAAQMPTASRLLSTLKGKAEREDLAAAEAIVEKSGLDWTILRPGKLTDNDPTGNYRMGTESKTILGDVSREDLAQVVVDEVERRTYLKTAAYIGKE